MNYKVYENEIFLNICHKKMFKNDKNTKINDSPFGKLHNLI